MTQWTLAVDFGTSYTTAAMSAAGATRVLEIDNSRYLPSVVCLDEDGELRTGRLASQLAAQLPGNAERLPKRALVGQAQVRLGARTYSSVDLVAAVLDRVRAEAVRVNGGTSPCRVVLTHPAMWGGHERGLLGKAAAAAGLANPDFVPEPVAAARQYAESQDIPPDGLVAVYDLGGGTFDVAVVQRTVTGFVVVGVPGGDPDLGGEDFDQALLELVGTRAMDLDPEPWHRLWTQRDRSALRAQSLLARDVREVREALTQTTTGYLTLPGYQREFMVRRREFEAEIEALIDQTIECFLDTVAMAGTTPGQLAAVVLAGGASRTPRVSDALSERIGVLPRLMPDPKSTVAQGALLVVERAIPADRPRHGRAEKPGRRERAAPPSAGSAPIIFRPDMNLFEIDDGLYDR